MPVPNHDALASVTAEENLLEFWMTSSPLKFRGQ
jgi:hypothetical protein